MLELFKKIERKKEKKKNHIKKLVNSNKKELSSWNVIDKTKPRYKFCLWLYRNESRLKEKIEDFIYNYIYSGFYISIKRGDGEEFLYTPNGLNQKDKNKNDLKNKTQKSKKNSNGFNNFKKSLSENENENDKNSTDNKNNKKSKLNNNSKSPEKKKSSINVKANKKSEVKNNGNSKKKSETKKNVNNNEIKPDENKNIKYRAKRQLKGKLQSEKQKKEDLDIEHKVKVIEENSFIDVYLEISKTHFKKIETWIQIFGIAPWKPLFDKDGEIKGTLVPELEQGNILTKFDIIEGKQYFLFKWKDSMYEGLNEVELRRLNINKNGIDFDMQFHIRPLYHPSSQGKIQTPISTLIEKYKDVEYYRKYDKLFSTMSFKSNFVIESKKDITKKTIKEIMEEKLVTADSVYLKQLSSSFSETEIDDDSDNEVKEKTVRLKNQEEIEKKMKEIQHYPERNIIALPPNYQHKPLTIVPFESKFIEKQRIYEEAAERALKHPVNFLKLLGTHRTNIGHIELIKETIKVMEKGITEVYTTFSTDLFHGLFRPFLNNTKKMLISNYENGILQIKEERLIEILKLLNVNLFSVTFPKPLKEFELSTFDNVSKLRAQVKKSIKK